LSGNRRQWFIELPLTMRQAITLELRARASVLVGKMREAHMESHPNGEMFYAGHTEGPWKVIEKANDYQTTDVVVGKTIVASNVSPSDSALIADAPLLLAEVKRLRERLDLAERYIIEPTLTRNYFADVVSKGLDNERDNLG
jgi:hypothetical protein